MGGCGGSDGGDDAGGGDSAPAAQSDGRDERHVAGVPGPADAPEYGFDTLDDEDSVDGALSSAVEAERNAVKAAPREATELLEQAAIISQAVVSAEADDVDKARFEAMKVMDNYKGTLAADESTTGDDGEMETARLVLRIPSEDYEAAYADLQKVGESVDSRSGSEDVTTEVIDVEARIRAQEQSLARIEALLAQAQDLRTIIAIESQLSRRQADLDSLKSRQAYLEDQTSMATITMHIEKTPEEEQKKDDDTGFLAGLSNGWDGLVATTVGIATVIGVLLPFAIVLALIGVPVMMFIRRLRPVPVTAPVEDQPSA